MNKLFAITLAAGLGFTLIANTALGAPLLKAQIMVSSPIVTVGDMFEGADLYAEAPLFRAPAPGTAGQVTLDAVRVAAARVGLTDFDSQSSVSVTVARFGEEIGEVQLGRMIENALQQRGILRDGVSATISFSEVLPRITADQSEAPVELVSLRYLGGTGQFSARFMVSGQGTPLDVKGRADLVVAVPHLVTSLSANDVIRPEDVEMRKVPVRTADTGSYSRLDQVIGQQIKRPARAGKMLQPGDLQSPAMIARNQAVTIVYRSGALTLTVKGQALDDAAGGETLQVLNLMSNKVLSAVATGQGLVTISDLGAMPTATR